MAKEKFQLTSDLVKVESEPRQHVSSNIDLKLKKNDPVNTVRLTINIDIELKQQLQFYAINNRRNMTDVIEEAIKERILYKK